MATNICEVCGETFEGKRKDCRTCSVKCKHTRSYTLFGKPKRPQKIPINCALCGKLFMPYRLTRNCFCSSYCRHKSKSVFRARKGLCRSCGKSPVDKGNCIVCRSKNNDKNLKQKYGITAIDYIRLLENQQMSCAICGRFENVGKIMQVRKLGVDHNHKTGQVRGLLCNWCNISMGWLEKYDSAISSYLKRDNARISV